jgi:phosphonoacetaldehyde hydrolase
MKSISEVIPGVILDWAGTMVDSGCCAPVTAMRRVLARHGCSLADPAIRQGMGRAKKEHLRVLLATCGEEAATEEIYPELEHEIFGELQGHAGLIPGAREFAQGLIERGIKIGTTTGYTRAMMTVLAEAAARQGYSPDIIITPDEVPAGRPAPYMIYANALKLGIWPLWQCVKIGDTPDDIAEGRNAGLWTVAVALSGNSFGLSLAQAKTLTENERQDKAQAARTLLSDAGADYVIDSVADAIPILEQIAGRIRAGDRPRS